MYFIPSDLILVQKAIRDYFFSRFSIKLTSMYYYVVFMLLKVI